MQVLGTFITEWQEGKERCEQMFCTMENAELVARQLTAIAVHFNFEGWLVNIENDLSHICLQNMFHFLR